MEKLYTVSKNKTRILQWLNHEPLFAKFRLKLKKAGKTTRPFRYDLNQIPNDYTVEVRNRFKGLDLIDRVPDELWTEVHDIVQDHPQTAILLFCIYFFLWMVLIPFSRTVSRTSIYSSSGILFIRSSPLNLFLTSTV